MRFYSPQPRYEPLRQPVKKENKEYLHPPPVAQLRSYKRSLSPRPVQAQPFKGPPKRSGTSKQVALSHSILVKPHFHKPDLPPLQYKEGSFHISKLNGIDKHIEHHRPPPLKSALKKPVDPDKIHCRLRRLGTFDNPRPGPFVPKSGDDVHFKNSQNIKLKVRMPDKKKISCMWSPMMGPFKPQEERRRK